MADIAKDDDLQPLPVLWTGPPGVSHDEYQFARQNWNDLVRDFRQRLRDIERYEARYGFQLCVREKDSALLTRLSKNR